MTMNVHLGAEEVHSIAELYRKPQGNYIIPAHDPNDDPIHVDVTVECDGHMDVSLDTWRLSPGEARHLAAVLLAAAEVAAWAIIRPAVVLGKEPV